MKQLYGYIAAAFVAGATLSSGNLWAQEAKPESGEYKPTVGQAGKDVVWVPTPQALVDKMLDMAELKAGERHVDLGSGDGRTVITAAKRGAIARGIEYNPDMVMVARKAAAAEGVTDRATFEQADIFQTDFSNAQVITLFLLPSLNVKLRPIILDMPPGTRVVSNTFPMEDWEPDEKFTVTEGCNAYYCTALKWIVPAKVGGTWQMGGKTLVLTQTFQMLKGEVQEGGSSTPISDAKLSGAKIQFTAGGQRYEGQVAGNQMRGTVNGAGAWDATLKSR
jgi:hypothetical protein